MSTERANGVIVYPPLAGRVQEAGVAGRARSQHRLQRRSVSVEVAEHIRSLIFKGTLKAEQRVPPHRGTFVVPIRSEDIEDHYRIYGMAQGLAARGAARRITEPVLARLDELHEQMCTNQDADLLHDLNWEFHSLINHTGASRRTLSILRQLSHNLPREVYSLPAAASPQANRGHARIIAALRAGDADQADLTNREHVQQEGDQVVGKLKRSGVLAT